MQLARSVLMNGLREFVLGRAEAAKINVPAIANFTDPAKAITEVLQPNSRDEALLSFGLKGSYSQITPSAPFQALAVHGEPLHVPDRHARAGQEESKLATGAETLKPSALIKPPMFSARYGLMLLLYVHALLDFMLDEQQIFARGKSSIVQRAS